MQKLLLLIGALAGVAVLYFLLGQGGRRDDTAAPPVATEEGVAEPRAEGTLERVERVELPVPEVSEPESVAQPVVEPEPTVETPAGLEEERSEPPLDREAGRLVLCLRSGPDRVVEDAAFYRLTKAVAGRPLPRFDELGCLAIDDCPEGPLRFEIHGPDGEVFVGRTNLGSGEDWNFALPLGGLATVEVDFVLPSHVTEALELSIEYELEAGFSVKRTRALQSLDPVRFEGVPAVPVGASLRTLEGEHLGTTSGQSLGTGELSLRIRVDDQAPRLRVVDAYG